MGDDAAAGPTAVPVWVQPGWTLPALVIGMALVTYGVWAIHHTWAIGDLCSVMSSVPACRPVLIEQNSGLVAVPSGLLVTFVGGFFALRRGRTAQANGTPWWIHGPSPSASRASLPGRAVLAGLVVTGVLSGVGANVWSTHSRAERVAAYHRAERALAVLVLPTSLHSRTSLSGCVNAPGQRCASSTLTPAQVTSTLVQLLRAKPAPTACGLWVRAS